MDEKKLRKLFRQRDTLIEAVNKALEDKVEENQRSLLRLFMEQITDKLVFNKENRVINNQQNRTLLLGVDNLFAKYIKDSNPQLLSTILGGVMSVLDFNAKYYSNLAEKTKLNPIKDKIKANIGAWLGIDNNKTLANGYLDTLVKSEGVKNDLKQSVMKMVYGQEGYESAKKGISRLIEGDKDNLGALQKYHRNFTYDLYSQIDRATAKSYADDLKFEFATYEGGIIKTSREFCKERNGKVFHKSEIIKFDPLKAKQPNYNPFTDLGGYGCRHHLNWIPNSLAIAMRPDAKDLVGAKLEEVEQKSEPTPQEVAKGESKAKAKADKVEDEKPKVLNPDDPFDDIPEFKIEPFTPSQKFKKMADNLKATNAKIDMYTTEIAAAVRLANELGDKVTARKADAKALELYLERKKVIEKHAEAIKKREEVRTQAEKERLKSFDELTSHIEDDGGLEISGKVPKRRQPVLNLFNRIASGLLNGTEIKYKQAKGRAFYNPYGKEITVSTSSENSVIIHELAHALEQNNHVMKASVDFLERRTKGNPIRPLTDISPRYGREERYQEGGFYTPYVGKYYEATSRGQNYKGRIATEVVSMGVEMMFSNPAKLMQEDKEHFDFIYSLIFKK